MFRRKVLPDELAEVFERFHHVVEVLEPAKAGLTDVLPGTRMPGRPLPDALAAYERALVAASPLMGAWRHVEVDEVWTACEAGIGRARERTTRARTRDEPVGFEGLLGLVTSLLDPLDPFADAEERFRRLRR